MNTRTVEIAASALLHCVVFVVIVLKSYCSSLVLIFVSVFCLLKWHLFFTFQRNG